MLARRLPSVPCQRPLRHRPKSSPRASSRKRRPSPRRALPVALRPAAGSWGAGGSANRETKLGRPALSTETLPRPLCSALTSTRPAGDSHTWLWGLGGGEDKTRLCFPAGPAWPAALCAGGGRSGVGPASERRLLRHGSRKGGLRREAGRAGGVLRRLLPRRPGLGRTHGPVGVRAAGRWRVGPVPRLLSRPRAHVCALPHSAAQG